MSKLFSSNQSTTTKDQVVRKSTTLSTRVNDTSSKDMHDIIFPNAEPKNRSMDPTKETPAPINPDEKTPTSPIKWGFAAALITHFANIFISGLTSKAPWACIHGTVNLAIVFLLAYIIYFWNTRFDTNLYVRRTLLRLSWAIDTLMLATFLGHLTVVIAVHRNSGSASDTSNDIYNTALGTIKKAAPWQPAISALLVILWTGFAYVQFVAVENIRGVQLPVSGALRSGQPNVTTIAEEVASSNSRPQSNETKDESNPVTRFVSDSLPYYGPMLGASFLCWTLGFPLTAGAPHVAVAGYVGAIAIAAPMVFQGLRSNVAGMICLGGALAYSVMAMLLNIMDAFSAPRSIRWINSTFIVVAQIFALGLLGAWYRSNAAEARVECEKAPVTLFRRKRDPSADDPMDFFMAGIAREEAV